MDDEQLRTELQKMIAREVREYWTAYRGAGTAELSRVGAELQSEMKRITNALRKERQEIDAAFAAPGHVDHVVRTWGRAILTGAFMFAGVVGAAWIGIAWTEQQLSVAGRKERGDRRTDCGPGAHPGSTQPRERRDLTLAGPDSEGHCFVLFPVDADVSYVLACEQSAGRRGSNAMSEREAKERTQDRERPDFRPGPYGC